MRKELSCWLNERLALVSFRSVMRSPQAWIGIPFLLLTSASRPAGLTAVLTQIEGTVTISETSPARSRAIPPRRAQVLQILGSGDEIHVPAKAGAGFVCSTDRWVELPERGGQRLTEELCRAGKPLPPGTYRRLAPSAGRLDSLRLTDVLEGTTRDPKDEAYGVPLLLSPRNTLVLEGRPTIRWTQVPEATDYEINLIGSAPFRLRIDAEDVTCGEGPGAAAACSLPWPEQQGDLPTGTASYLKVGARLGLAAPLREPMESSRVQRLAPKNVEEIQSQLDALNFLPLEGIPRLLLEADLYTHKGLLADAISAYVQALALQDTPEVRVTLGDAYLKIKLLRLAAQTYKEALDTNPGPAVEAACELGLGRVEYTRRNFEWAREHFRRARVLYFSVGQRKEAMMLEKSLSTWKKSDNEL